MGTKYAWHVFIAELVFVQILYFSLKFFGLYPVGGSYVVRIVYTVVLLALALPLRKPYSSYLAPEIRKVKRRRKSKH